jgi:hypothetical protein
MALTTYHCLVVIKKTLVTTVADRVIQMGTRPCQYLQRKYCTNILIVDPLTSMRTQNTGCSGTIVTNCNSTGKLCWGCFSSASLI